VQKKRETETGREREKLAVGLYNAASRHLVHLFDMGEIRKLAGRI
jgi:hypothetical protein